MGIRFVPPVEAAVQHVLLESHIYDQVLARGKIGLKGVIDGGQLLPCRLRCCDFLLRDEKPKIRKGKLRRKLLVQCGQMVPDIFRGGHFLFVDKQMQKRKVQIRSSRQRLIKNPIRVSGCTPAEQESRVNGLGIVCKNDAKITKCPFRITLNQEEVCGLPSNVRCCWVRFHGVFDTLSLLAGTPGNLVGPRQIQPVPSFVRIQMYGCPILRNTFVQTYAGQRSEEHTSELQSL